MRIQHDDIINFSVCIKESFVQIMYLLIHLFAVVILFIVHVLRKENKCGSGLLWSKWMLPSLAFLSQDSVWWFAFVIFLWCWVDVHRTSFFYLFFFHFSLWMKKMVSTAKQQQGWRFTFFFLCNYGRRSMCTDLTKLVVNLFLSPIRQIHTQWAQVQGDDDTLANFIFLVLFRVLAVMKSLPHL